MLTTLKSRLAAMKAAPQNINSALETIDDMRAQIDALRAEQAAVLNAPRPAAEVFEDLDRRLDEMATGAVDRLRLDSLLDRRAPAEIRVPMAPGRDLAEQYVNTEVATRTLLGLIIAAAREPLRDLIAGQIKDRLEGREPMTDEQIEARVAEIDDALLAAELAEEASIRALERAGISVDRRADADPLAVLAVDSALPSG